MNSLRNQIEQLVTAAMLAAFGDSVRDADALIKASDDARFGDYQANVAMSLGKKLGAKPRDIAQQIVDKLDPFAQGTFETQIAGPGFINIKLRDEFVQNALQSIPPATAPDRLGIDALPSDQRERVVVDYSSPNVAKEMHVGHLRSTIIGDAIVRALAFQGHEVIRQNHLGDWGTQFGKIILALWHLCMGRHQNETAADFNCIADEITQTTDAAAKAEMLENRRKIHQENLDRDPQGAEFSRFIQSFEPSFDQLLPAYRFVNAIEEAAEKSNLEVANKTTGERYPLSGVSRHVAAMLQGKTAYDNTQELAAWRKARDATLKECDAIYRRLGVLICEADARGESFYEPLLPGVVAELQTSLGSTEGQSGDMRAVCRVDQGAVCVFLEKPDGSPAFKGAQGDPLPMIIRKSDGASLYATTDLGAALFRTAHSTRHPITLHDAGLKESLQKLGGGLGADRVLYVVGAPAKLHFDMLFATIQALGWLKTNGGEVHLEHVAFGSVLGSDRKMLRTRSGDSVKLKDLLEEAVQRSEALVRETEADVQRRRGFSEQEIRHIAETIGIASVKYADLCQNRSTDYVFSWEKMLALQGNTAPYMLYAYARVRSIYRKALESRPFDINVADAPIRISHPAERALAMRILQLSEVIDAVGGNLLPSMLCDYLYDLAGRFMSFYENCPVVQAPDAATYASRLRLSELTSRALAIGLGLLGIGTLEKM
jgi:arginyl-tRNA synthetase